jgi:hypothetical protein
MLDRITVDREGTNGPVARFGWSKTGVRLTPRRMRALVEKIADLEGVAECTPDHGCEYIDVKRGTNLTWGGSLDIENRVRDLIDRTLVRAEQSQLVNA